MTDIFENIRFDEVNKQLVHLEEKYKTASDEVRLNRNDIAVLRLAHDLFLTKDLPKHLTFVRENQDDMRCGDHVMSDNTFYPWMMKDQTQMEIPVHCVVDRATSLTSAVQSREHFERFCQSELDQAAHLAGHIRENGIVPNEYCDREIFAESGRGLNDQVRMAMEYLKDKKYETFDEIVQSFDDVLPTDETDMDDDGLLDALMTLAMEDHEIFNTLCNQIEENSLLFWEDGDLYLNTCNIIEQGEDEWYIPIEESFYDIQIYTQVKRCPGDPSDHHIKLLSAGGGPSAVLTRDFSGDQLICTWWSEEKVYRNKDIDTVLEYFADRADDFS